MTRALAAAALACALVWVFAEPVQLQEPAFQFVSIRRTPSTAASFRVLTGGLFEVRSASLEDLARIAYGFEHLDPRRGLVERPRFSWGFGDHYDLTATTDREWSTPASGDRVPPELRLMLRNVLTNRFGLRARMETKKTNVYALHVAGAPGPSLRPSAGQCLGPFVDSAFGQPALPRCPFTSQPDRVEARNVTLADVARVLSGRADFFIHARPVVDQTGLAGTYDLTLVLPPTPMRVEVFNALGREDEREVPYSQRFGAARQALQAQLGLELREAKLPVPTLVIEGAKRPQED